MGVCSLGSVISVSSSTGYVVSVHFLLCNIPFCEYLVYPISHQWEFGLLKFLVIWSNTAYSYTSLLVKLFIFVPRDGIAPIGGNCSSLLETATVSVAISWTLH